MYKVTKTFIYRAKLYAVGQELSDKRCQRMMKDKVAARRGIPAMVAPQEPPEPVVEADPVPPVVSHETKEKKKPGRKPREKT